MAEYIERKKFLSRLNYICNAYGISKFLKEKFKKAIDDCTTADVVEVVHGYWIITEEILETIRECSCCHCKTYYPKPLSFNVRKSPYCEDCGAKMDAERKKSE